MQTLASPYTPHPLRPSAYDRDLARALAAASSLHMRRTGVAQHARRVAPLAAATAVELGHSGARAARIRMAALVHDVGKAWIPERVLLKPGPLSADEWRLIEAHPLTAAGLLSHPALADVAEWVRCHHERADGRGYPHGRVGAESPVESRILAVCDAFDAMTSARPNGPPLRPAAALAELDACAGTQFDPVVVEAFRRVAA